MKEKVVFFGLSTEGYHLASKMVINGADVRIIDESSSSAIVLNSEIAKTYSNVISLREDEPLLAMEPSNIAEEDDSSIIRTFAPLITILLAREYPSVLNPKNTTFSFILYLS